VTTLQITQRRSTAGSNPSQRATLRTLGLRGIGSAVERTDEPAVQGMIRAVAHLVEVRHGAGKGSDG
jgi:large subunit ribosomal protein L30